MRLTLLWAAVLLQLPCLAQPVSSLRSRDASDPALTAKQRWSLLVRNNLLSPAVVMRTLAPTTAAHLREDPVEWERSAGGFGRRLQTQFVVQTSRGLINSAGAAALGHDPRYQRCGCRGGWRRAGHALSSLFVAADATGQRRLDPSPLLSAYGSGYLGATLYPDRYRVSVKGYQIGSQQAAQIVMQNVALEFGPELRRFRKFVFRR